MYKVFSKPVFKLTITAALLLTANAASASGFALLEESVSMMGNEYAGAGAAGVDASNEYYNAAQASLFKKTHVSIGAVAIPVGVTFNGDLMSNSALGVQKEATVKNLKATKWGFVPSFHLVAPLVHRLSFAFGVTAPFGLESDYDADQWVVSSPPVSGTLGAPTNTAIMGINFNPSFSYKLNSSLAIAAGVDIMYASAKYDVSANGLGSVGSLVNDLTGWGVGYNIGLLYSLGDSARVGLSYRSSISVDAAGYSEIKSQSRINKASATLDLPGNVLLSGFYRFNQYWDGLASVQYTTWSVLKHLKIDGVLSPLGDEMPVNSDLNYKNTWFFSLGTNYHLNQQWSFSLGAGYDQTPTQDGYRDLRLPGSDRYVVAIGAHWNPYSFMKVDVAYQHIFTGKANVDSSKRSDVKHPDPIAFYAKGTAQMDINLIGVGVDFTF